MKKLLLINFQVLSKEYLGFVIVESFIIICYRVLNITFLFNFYVRRTIFNIFLFKAFKALNKNKTYIIRLVVMTSSNMLEIF